MTWVEAASFLGEADFARIAIEEPHADPGLQTRHGPAHRRRRQAEHFRGAGKIPSLRNRRQDTDAGQKPRVESHSISLRLCGSPPEPFPGEEQ